jgi:hypothetical protein
MGHTNLNDTLHVGQLALAARQLNIVGDVDSEGGEVAADNLTSEILLILNHQGVLGAALLNLTSRLDAVVGEIAMFATEALELWAYQYARSGRRGCLDSQCSR